MSVPKDATIENVMFWAGEINRINQMITGSDGNQKANLTAEEVEASGTKSQYSAWMGSAIADESEKAGYTRREFPKTGGSYWVINEDPPGQPHREPSDEWTEETS